MNISEDGLRLIKEFEGLSTNLYIDPVGHCTIGVGHLVHLGACDGRAEEAPFEKGITEQQALDLLRSDVTRYEGYVEQVVRVPLGQHQFDALVSFCYNVGGGGLRDSSVAAVLNERRYGTVCRELRKYVRGAGDPDPLPGLIRRREAECALFNEPDAVAIEEDVMVIGQFAKSIPWDKSYIVTVGKEGARKTLVASAAEYESLLAAGFPVKQMDAKKLAAIISSPGTPEPDAP